MIHKYVWLPLGVTIKLNALNFGVWNVDKLGEVPLKKIKNMKNRPMKVGFFFGWKINIKSSLFV